MCHMMTENMKIFGILIFQKRVKRVEYIFYTLMWEVFSFADISVNSVKRSVTIFVYSADQCRILAKDGNFSSDYSLSGFILKTLYTILDFRNFDL